MGYTLSDMVSEFGLTMSEFNKLSAKTQEKWRRIHQKRHNELQKYGCQIDAALKTGEVFLFQENTSERLMEREIFIKFLADKHIDKFTYDNFTDGQKRVFEKQYQEYKKQFKQFLESKFLTIEQFYMLADWKKEEWQKQFVQHIKQEQYWKQKRSMSKDELAQKESNDVLHDCNIPFDVDGPLGI